MELRRYNEIMDSTFGRRTAAFAIDLFIIMWAVFTVAGAILGPDIASIDNIKFIILIGLVLFILKDVFGRSLGKCITSLKIINVKNPSEKVSVSKRILHNIATPLWFVDVIQVLHKGEKYKMMDKELGLDVVRIINNK
jgi:uncharacterized RDD family membrane protein YckC